MIAPSEILWRGSQPLVLASKSRVRAELLRQAGLPVETVPSSVDERALENEWNGRCPTELAVTLAKAKAMDVKERCPGRIVIGADQVLDFNGTVLHKPADLDDGLRHLLRLQGQTHSLHSAVAILCGSDVECFCETARLTMRPLDELAIGRYLEAAGEDAVTGSVGAYQLERVGIHLFAAIEGDHSTILGLPLLPLLARLRAMNLLIL